MARKRAHKPSVRGPQRIAAGDILQTGPFTGRHLVLLRDNGIKEGLQALKSIAGLSDVCNAADFGASALEMTQANQSDAFVLDHLKVAVVNAEPSQVKELRVAADDDGPIQAIEPERVMYALSTSAQPPTSPLSLEYLRGYRDGIDQLVASLAGAATNKPTLEPAPGFIGFADNLQYTWGIQATRVNECARSGRGVRVAVLDTGCDLEHPDFAGRTIVSQTFVAGQAVNDLNGHGTHCIGTSLGAKLPAGGGRRYGCAFDGEIYVGKVLSNQGSGADGGILAGINWAIANRCRVVSMSLGAPVLPGESFSIVYENVAQRALKSNPGPLIVAAAGNDSRDQFTGNRFDPPRPVGRPANCPSVLAVGAVDANLGIASFSNGGINPDGGGVDIAGPGVAIFSSVPTPFPPEVQPVGPGRPWPARYHTISGTSMATPHVAGIAALWLEERGPSTNAQALWQILTGTAKRLSLMSRDVGAGLVQAPI